MSKSAEIPEIIDIGFNYIPKGSNAEFAALVQYGENQEIIEVFHQDITTDDGTLADLFDFRGNFGGSSVDSALVVMPPTFNQSLAAETLPGLADTQNDKDYMRYVIATAIGIQSLRSCDFWDPEAEVMDPSCGTRFGDPDSPENYSPVFLPKFAPYYSRR